MNRGRNNSMLMIFCCIIPIADALSQNNTVQRGIRMPSIAEARENLRPSIRLESYNLKGHLLSCTLSDGGLVEISPIDDVEDFTFLAIRSKLGRIILANERFTKEKNVNYSIFSFYKECAIHNLVTVNARGPGDGDIYSRQVMKVAECLAVEPTKTILGIEARLSLSQIASRLQDENGAVTSTRAELEKCTDKSFVKKMVVSLPASR